MKYIFTILLYCLPYFASRFKDAVKLLKSQIWLHWHVYHDISPNRDL